MHIARVSRLPVSENIFVVVELHHMMLSRCDVVIIDCLQSITVDTKRKRRRSDS